MGQLLALLFCQLILRSLAEGGRGRVSPSLPTLTKGWQTFPALPLIIPPTGGVDFRTERTHWIIARLASGRGRWTKVLQLDFCQRARHLRRTSPYRASLISLRKVQLGQKLHFTSFAVGLNSEVSHFPPA